MRGARWVVLGILAFGVACNSILGLEGEYRLTAGALECRLSSDCSSGQKCIFKTCGVECAGDQDCALGLRCLKTAGGSAACVSSTQATCSEGGQECPPGTACSTGTCRNRCIPGTLECLASQFCVDSFCRGIDPTRDAVSGGSGGMGMMSGGAPGTPGVGGMPSGGAPATGASGGAVSGGSGGSSGGMKSSLPGCVGLANNCGVSANLNCCATTTVPGGTFNRSNDAASPATVSDFKLDNYEVTVGRFRSFVAAYTQPMIATGAGKNANNPSDLGWEEAWNTSLPANAAVLNAEVNCDSARQTWTDLEASNETRPMNCVSWYVAQAFCIWDGGRLPTEAEWNYTAVGGSEQRVYPWGATVPEANAALAVHDCRYDGMANCSPLDVAPVGSVIAGNGKWGHSDLAGSMAEWNQDWHSNVYPSPCSDCAQLTTSTMRVYRGGSYNSSSVGIKSASRLGIAQTTRSGTLGFRCARSL